MIVSLISPADNTRKVIVWAINKISCILVNSHIDSAIRIACHYYIMLQVKCISSHLLHAACTSMNLMFADPASWTALTTEVKLNLPIAFSTISDYILRLRLWEQINFRNAFATHTVSSHNFHLFLRLGCATDTAIHHRIHYIMIT